MKPIPKALAEMIANLPIRAYERRLGAMVPLCRTHFDLLYARDPGTYTGPNKKLGDYYVRVHHYTPKARYVYVDIVGVDRRERVLRREFDRQARAA